MKKALAAAALTAMLPLCSHAADVTLEVEGLDASRLAGATLMVAVFTDPAGWLRQPQSGQRFVLGAEAANGKVSVVLKDLPDGPLALSLFQDANANGRLDMNAMGIPTEPYGFSNNADGGFGPPKFEQAVMTPAAGVTIKVRMN
ncbi:MULTISPECIES: DUF2141 domain-containing protein [unclassified Roseateles]|uniref:DUF2141 domain-containing protein n=1 Tax=unclassified Roseateles TaxID=2626991 RepID=UPI0006F24E97|nr:MULTISPECIES: DUF2141 domain-containing protein [unclassified Roseateles]KQW41234.1 hypothetical protein ASC81_23440 [Pelomonas sp. Root405]KRA68005.1 hypothetical protein ASD88_21420 [Pelomonas sp. Root662]